MDKEPVAIVGLIQAVVLVLVAFGYLALTQQQVTAVNGVIAAAGAVLIPLLGAVVARSQVTPVAKVDQNAQLIQAAANFHGAQGGATADQVQQTASEWGAWMHGTISQPAKSGQPPTVVARAA